MSTSDPDNKHGSQKFYLATVNTANMTRPIQKLWNYVFVSALFETVTILNDFTIHEFEI